MCKLSKIVIKEAEEHYLIWRLDEVHYEHHLFNDPEDSVNFVINRP